MSMTATYHVTGMHCASCSGLIERTVGKLAGVASVSANYANESMSLTYKDAPLSPDNLVKVLKPLGYNLDLPLSGKTDIALASPAANTTLKVHCGMGMYDFAVNFTS
jgi:copper chaperone CopZ